MAQKEAGPMSGFRDMLAKVAIPRQKVIEKIRQVYENYGFVPLDTPALERLSTLTGRYGEEGEKLMYKFKDQGGKDVALRYDLTVPLARVVGQHRSEIPMPYRRYQVGNVWRGDSPQAGRYREFMQFDADNVGSKSSLADAEVVTMMSDTMGVLGVTAIIRINNRRILDALTEKLGLIEDKDKKNVITEIDKVAKIGKAKVVQTLSKNYGAKIANQVQDFLSVNGSAENQLSKIGDMFKGQQAAEEGIDNLLTVFKLARASNYQEDRIVLDTTIARGLTYYTGIIYETELVDLPEIGSVFSGGRYDNLVAELGGPDIPAVGASVGVDRLMAGLEQLGKIEKTSTPAKVVVTNLGKVEGEESFKVASELRRNGIPSELVYDFDKLGRQLKKAGEAGIPIAVMIGSKEIAHGTATIKDLRNQNQVTVLRENVVAVINEWVG